MAREQAPALRLILDSGAVIAMARGKSRVWDEFTAWNRRCDVVIVPAVVVAEVIRGGPADAIVNRFLKTVDKIAAVSERTARRAGALLGAAGSSDTVDALVVAEATVGGGGAVVMTGDPRDLRELADGLGNVHVVIV